MDAYNIRVFLFFMTIGLMASCVKDPQDIPGSKSEDEIFGLQGTFGNEILDIGAGLNQWTNIPVAVQGDSLLVYTSVLSIDGCLEHCNSSWTFNFYQAQPALQDAQQDFLQTIKVGDKEILDADVERKQYDVMLSTHPGLFMSGYSYWEDLNMPDSTFFYEFQTTVGYEEIIDVCFQSKAYTGCLYKQCITFDPVTEVPCLARIEPKLENPRYLSLTVKPTGTAPFQVLWSNGATTQSRVIALQDTVAEIFVEVQVTDALGNRSVLSQTIRVQTPAVDACYFPIDLTSTPVQVNASELFEDRVEVTFVDQAGSVWSSTGGVQSQQSFYKIDELSYYGISPLGQPSYLVDMTANMLLYNVDTGESKLFNTNRLSLALSHP